MKSNIRTKKMLEKVRRAATDIWLLADDAIVVEDQTFREKQIEKIIKLHEKIDDLLSSPWH